MIRLWRNGWFERTPPIEQVDFGNGYFVSADDLLDGHFQQLTANTEESLPLPPSPLDPELHRKIENVAPQLTPLTDLAENVAKTIPEAHPTVHFRTTLNKALTETHRQHSAQRTIGIRPSPTQSNEWQSIIIVGLILMVITFGVALYGRHLNKPAKV